ncbi:MAG: CvpA family protein [Alphaproteobacteria bacterium]|jgi:membrane protein required for colicin V production|nr:CvpA family protein [Alphaproteobacteria bacterium]
MDISAFNYVDYTILAVLAASGLLAMLRGFMRELLGALGWVVAVIVARLSEGMASDQLQDYINDEALTSFLGWMLPFIIVVFAWYIFANLAAPGLKKMAMGVLDRPLGFIFGVLRGLVLVAIVYMSALLLYESEDHFAQPVLDAALISPVRVTASTISGFAPEEWRDDLQDAIPDQDLDDLKDGLINSTEEAAEDAIDNADETAKSIGGLLPDEITTPNTNN